MEEGNSSELIFATIVVCIIIMSCDCLNLMENLDVFQPTLLVFIKYLKSSLH